MKSTKVMSLIAVLLIGVTVFATDCGKNGGKDDIVKYVSVEKSYYTSTGSMENEFNQNGFLISSTKKILNKDGTEKEEVSEFFYDSDDYLIKQKVYIDGVLDEEVKYVHDKGGLLTTSDCKVKYDSAGYFVEYEYDEVQYTIAYDSDHNITKIITVRPWYQNYDEGSYRETVYSGDDIVETTYENHQVVGLNKRTVKNGILVYNFSEFYENNECTQRDENVYDDEGNSLSRCQYKIVDGEFTLVDNEEYQYNDKGVLMLYKRVRPSNEELYETEFDEDSMIARLPQKSYTLVRKYDSDYQVVEKYVEAEEEEWEKLIGHRTYEYDREGNLTSFDKDDGEEHTEYFLMPYRKQNHELNDFIWKPYLHEIPPNWI